MRRFASTTLCLSVCGLLLAPVPARAGERGVPGIEGIPNFTKVNDRLFRGAQPSDFGLQRLKELGAKSIIDLRMPAEVRKAEKTIAMANGMVYTNIPLRGLGAPRDDQVTAVLGLIDTLPSPVFVHCVHGCDRTGTIIACYRIARDRWSGESALAEAKTHGLSDLERGMKKYIREFAKPPKKAAPPQAR